jgi:hypothetical protein
MPKHGEDMGGIGEKNIGEQLGLVRIYLTQWAIISHSNPLQNLPFRNECTRGL